MCSRPPIDIQRQRDLIDGGLSTMEMRISKAIQIFFISAVLAAIAFGAGWYSHKECPECVQAIPEPCPTPEPQATFSCPAIPACPACPTMSCNCKSTADKSIHFRVPSCENYTGKIRARGDDQITYRWYDCTAKEWVEGDVDSDGWLQI